MGSLNDAKRVGGDEGLYMKRAEEIGRAYRAGRGNAMALLLEHGELRRVMQEQGMVPPPPLRT